MKNLMSTYAKYAYRLFFSIGLCFISLWSIAQNNMVTIGYQPAQLDEQVCFDLHLFNFDNYGAGVYEISWDNTVCELVDTKSNKDGFFQTLNESKSSYNKVNFSITKEMIANRGYAKINPEICFLTKKEGVSPITISKIGSLNKNNFKQGGLTVLKTPFIGERLIASQEIANSGTETCVSISVEGFTTINKLTFGVLTDASIATFSRSANYNIPDLTAANVMDLGAFGVLVDWDAPNQTTGVTVPDGTVIVDLCYDVVGPPGAVADITFNAPTVFNIFFSIDGSQNVPMLDEGSISIPNFVPLAIDDSDILPDNCFDIDNGEVQITPSGGVPPYTYSWSNMTTNQNLTGVPGGMYTVTISDDGTPVNQLVMSFTVPIDMDAPTADAGPIQSITCLDSQLTLGSNNTSVGDEFEYQWTAPGVTFISGQMDVMADIDQPATYTLLVINTLNGCTAESIVLVEDNTSSPNLMVPADQPLTCQVGGLILSAMNDEGLTDLNASWDSTDGTIDQVVDNLSISISTPGTYTVVLTNEDNGCTETSSVIISPAEMPTILLNEEVQDINCDLPTTTFTVTVDPMNLVTWTTSNGSIDSGENTPTVTVSSAGIYIAEVTDAVTNCTNTIEIEVFGDASEPVVMAGEDMTITCDSPIVTLSGFADDMTTIAWTDPDGNFAGNQLTLDANREGTYTLNVSNDFGCMRSDELVVAVDTMMPIANPGVDMEIACITSDIALDGSGSSMGPEFEYMWTTSNGILVSGFNTLTPLVSSAGTYDLLVTNTENGCTSMNNIEISIQGNLPTAFAGDDFSTCEDNAMLIGNLDVGVTGMWTTTSNANIDNPSAAQISISNLSPGVNEFRWSLSTGDCADFSTDIVLITFESTPITTEDIFTIPLDSSMISSNVILNDNVANNTGGITVDFSPADPNFMDLGDGSFNYTFPNDSIRTINFSYIVCSEVCPLLCDSANISLVREEPPLMPVDLSALPNAITPNGDGLNDALVFDIMITNPQDFPNPELVVFNRWGDVVFKQQPYDNNWQGTNQNGDELPEGTYYFVNRLSLENTEILSGDITIIRE